jgi:hypothetical protein
MVRLLRVRPLSTATPKQRFLAFSGGALLTLLLLWALGWDMHLGLLSSGSGATPILGVGHRHVRLEPYTPLPGGAFASLLARRLVDTDSRVVLRTQASPRTQEQVLKERNAELEAELVRLRAENPDSKPFTLLFPCRHDSAPLQRECIC